jgi:hypothetical protein
VQQHALRSQPSLQPSPAGSTGPLLLLLLLLLLLRALRLQLVRESEAQGGCASNKALSSGSKGSSPGL